MIEVAFLASLPDFERHVVELLQDAIGICEDAPFTNRGVDVDRINARFGSPLGSYWCGNLMGGVFADADAWHPEIPGDCDNWINESKNLIDDKGSALWLPRSRVTMPPVAAAVLYGTRIPWNALHIGGAVRNTPLVQTIEGNTTTGGFQRNGHTVALKEPDLSIKSPDEEQVIGYVRAVPRDRVRKIG